MDEIRTWWEVPSIAHFCSLFKIIFNLVEFDIEDIEVALFEDNVNVKSQLIQDLLINLIQGCYLKKAISEDNYEESLQKIVLRRYVEEGKENPFVNVTSFHELGLRTKVEVLHTLCNCRLDAYDVVEALQDLEADSLRIEPLGQDDKDNTYWYFYGIRLYKESPPPKKPRAPRSPKKNVDNGKKTKQRKRRGKRGWAQTKPNRSKKKNKREEPPEKSEEDSSPKRKRGRPSRAKVEQEVACSPAKRSSRGRPRKTSPENEPKSEGSQEGKRSSRGRPRKISPENEPKSEGSEETKRSSRGRPRKISPENEPKSEGNEETKRSSRGRPRKITPENEPKSDRNDENEETEVKDEPQISDPKINNEENEETKVKEEPETSETKMEVEKADMEVEKADKEVEKADEEEKKEETAVEKKEEKIEVKSSPIKKQDVKPTATWSVICYNEDDWKALAETFKESRSNKEKDLCKTITESFLPEIGRIAEEREKEKRRMELENLPRRHSTRIDKIKKKRIYEPEEEEPECETTERVTRRQEYLRNRDEEEETKVNKELERMIASQERAKRAQLREQRAIEADFRPKTPSPPPPEVKFSNTRHPIMSMKEMYTGFRKVLKVAQNHKDAWPFLQPVDDAFAPDYSNRIKKPMDLSTIAKKVESRCYRNKREFQDDLMLIVINCRRYNGDISDYTKMAERLRMAFNKALCKVFPPDMMEVTRVIPNTVVPSQHTIVPTQHTIVPTQHTIVPSQHNYVKHGLEQSIDPMRRVNTIPYINTSFNTNQLPKPHHICNMGNNAPLIKVEHMNNTPPPFGERKHVKILPGMTPVQIMEALKAGKDLSKPAEPPARVPCYAPYAPRKLISSATETKPQVQHNIINTTASSSQVRTSQIHNGPVISSRYPHLVQHASKSAATATSTTNSSPSKNLDILSTSLHEAGIIEGEDEAIPNNSVIKMGSSSASYLNQGLSLNQGLQQSLKTNVIQSSNVTTGLSNQRATPTNNSQIIIKDVSENNAIKFIIQPSPKQEVTSPQPITSSQSPVQPNPQPPKRIPIYKQGLPPTPPRTIKLQPNQPIQIRMAAMGSDGSTPIYQVVQDAFGRITTHLIGRTQQTKSPQQTQYVLTSANNASLVNTVTTVQNSNPVTQYIVRRPEITHTVNSVDSNIMSSNGELGQTLGTQIVTNNTVTQPVSSFSNILQSSANLNLPTQLLYSPQLQQQPVVISSQHLLSAQPTVLRLAAPTMVTNNATAVNKVLPQLSGQQNVMTLLQNVRFATRPSAGVQHLLIPVNSSVKTDNTATTVLQQASIQNGIGTQYYVAMPSLDQPT